YAYLRIDGMAVDSNDDGGDGNNARLMTVLPRTGTYTLVVTPYSSSSEGGRYSVSLNLSEAPPGAGRVENLRVGQRVSGRLEFGDRPRSGGGYQDLWEFEGRADQDVIIEMQSGDFDSFLELRDQNGAVISENDDGGEGQDALIITRLPSNGRYRVVARSYGESERTGFYELSLSTTSAVGRPGRAGEITPGQVITGRLERGDSLLGDSTYADVYTFRANEAGELTIDMRSADFDAYLILRGPEGETLATDDDGGDGTNSRISWRVERGRTYRIYANSYGEDRAVGLYRLSVRFDSR
ncbi:MAG TPA: PPC domain-containing protein, partial [Hyphomicrobium sp.]|nr:PPC domain-containing protein [Hyphomicrobium sp.]